MNNMGMLVRRPGVVLERMGPEAVLHDSDSGLVHVINRTAARVWELCNGSRNGEQVAVALAAEFGLQAADVADDVGALAGQFRSLGLMS
jgi:hypothetical protein